MHWIWRSIVVSTLLSAGVFLFIFYSETGELPALKNLWTGFSLAILLGNLVGAGLIWINHTYNKVLPWNKHITGRFLLEVFSGIIVVMVAAFIYVYAFVDQVVEVDAAESFWAEYWDGIVKFGIVALVLIYLFSMVSFSVFSYNRYAVYQIKALSLEREQLDLQFEALKSQLSPHFLFNSLNTISSLIYKDIQLAENFIRQLAHTYSYILGNDDERLVKLEDELQMTHAFFEMQKTRYGDAVNMKIQIPTTFNQTLIPPLTLQMLLENALKHNMVDEANPLTIQITVDEKTKELIIRNNHVPKPELLKIGNNLVDRPNEEHSHKIGLSNIRKRYAFFTNRKPQVLFEEDFIVKLPLIEANDE